MFTAGKSTSPKRRVLARRNFAVFGLVILSALLFAIYHNSADKELAQTTRHRDPEPKKQKVQNHINSRPTVSDRIIAADWTTRRDVFENALEDPQQSLEELWIIFEALNREPGEKFGVANIATALFSAYAAREPAVGLEKLKLLDAGIVRRQALLGYTSKLQANQIEPLIKSIKSDGFPHEELDQIGLYLHSTIDKFTFAQAKSLLDSNYFSPQIQQDLESIISKADFSPVTIQASTPSGTHADPRDGNEIADTEEIDRSENQKENLLAYALFNSELTKDRFGAANSLQRGIFASELISGDLVRNVSRLLAAEDPNRALTWATNWDDPAARETAVSSVIWSWLRYDPLSATTKITELQDPNAKDIASLEVVQYLVSRKSLEEASAWANGIVDADKKSRAVNLIKGSKP